MVCDNESFIVIYIVWVLHRSRCVVIMGSKNYPRQFLIRQSKKPQFKVSSMMGEEINKWFINPIFHVNLHGELLGAGVWGVLSFFNLRLFIYIVLKPTNENIK